jgi:hypothetical protein
MRTPSSSAGISGQWGWLLLLTPLLIWAGCGQALGHAAAAIFRSPETVLAAVDTKNDGTVVKGVMYAALADTPEAKNLAHDSEIPGAARLVEQIQSDIQRKLAAVAQVWCHQTIYRYSQRGKTARPIDKIEADVELLNGVETYTSVRRGSNDYPGFREARGIWSSGELATMLRTSRNVIISEPGAVTGIGTQDGDAVAVLSFRHISPRAAWVIEIGSRAYPISFDGQILVSRTSGEIKRIRWLGIDLPAKMGVSAVEWSVSFGPSVVAGKADTRPTQSTYTVVYKGTKTRLDRNLTLFSDFRGYSSDAVISYEPEALYGLGGRPQTAPAGLPDQPPKRNAAPLRRVF